jgi:multidrug efflux pump subunit AcrB
VEQGAAQDQAHSWRWAKEGGNGRMAPAVSIAIAKRNGANAVNVSQGVVARVEALKGS